MILDTSAVVAVVRAEPPSTRILQRIFIDPSCRISAANLFESYMVIDRSGALEAAEELADFLDSVRPVVEPVTREQADLAREAFRRFGKGSGHPARLNFGDCFAYALARFYNEPLLFIGNDFAATDIEPTLPASNL